MPGGDRTGPRSVVFVTGWGAGYGVVYSVHGVINAMPDGTFWGKGWLSGGKL